MGLRAATAINVATMVGAGPFITLPLVVVALHGSVSALAWAIGAVIALCDGLVWAELAARFPRSGGTYAYLREAFGPQRAGRLFAFLFVWQYLFWAPLTIASGYIGFAQYAAYLVPALAAPGTTHAVALAVGVITLAALYRAIPQVARTGLALGAVALLTLGAVALAGLAHPHVSLAHSLSATLSTRVALPALGAALVITLYDYSGYADVCALGDEVIAPTHTIPRAVVLSVVFVGAAYLLLNLGAVSALSPHEIASASAVASVIAQRALGVPFAVVVTLAILVTAFGSTYGLLLAASRVPYAAARDGDFLPAFARLHPRAAFPSVSLVAIGVLALPAVFFPLDAVIAALTAGIVLIQGVAQIVALFVVRRRSGAAPFRVPLYPLPALIALTGWVVLFWSTGRTAMAFGLGTLGVGLAIYLVRAWRGAAWPFRTVAAASALLCCVALPHPAQAATPTFGHAAIVQRNGQPTLVVDGKPFFFWGGAFFYERIPPARWRTSMLAMRALGANTLDLYIPWNWHEISDGVFDFDGHTDPRRNLRRVLRLGSELGFHFIIRPGPVIRNEWRNGGYPAWLLTRPEYDMPLHDVIEGRYPATATLQNVHSDDAAAEWLRNTTHLRYASRWLHRALAELRPYADRVIAVQLDDDQAAYINNQTYPAPHVHQYLGWLESQVRDVIGPVTPTFINTYQMRVPASSPVWTMGNWYQSDAYTIGLHDRVDLDFSTLLLATNPRGPLAQSEFQAGWLAGPEDPQPRSADPRNTTLALDELLALGVKGIIDFPLQDTYAEPGWEAPFSNAFYRWDAALRFNGTPGPRYAATHAFGTFVRRFGPLLATAHRVATTAIAYAEPPPRADSVPPDGAAAVVARVRAALAGCIQAGITCDLIDVRHPPARLTRYATIVVPPEVAAAAPDAIARLRARNPATTTIVGAVPPTQGTGVVTLAGPGVSFRFAANWSDAPIVATVAGVAVRVPAHDVAIRVAAGAPPPAVPIERAATASHIVCDAAPMLPLVPDGAVVVERRDPCSGAPETILANDRLWIAFDPQAGGRAFHLVARNGATPSPDAFDATGAMRDDVSSPLPPSPRDYIAAYTHGYPAGTFNRAYRVTVLASGAAARVRFSYAMPDASPSGIGFERIVTLRPHATRVVVDERLVAPPGATSPQRAVVRSSLPLLMGALAAGALPAGVTALAAARAGVAFIVAWRDGDIEGAARWTPYRSTGTLALTLAPGWRRTVYALMPAATPAAVDAAREAERAWVAANAPDERP